MKGKRKTLSIGCQMFLSKIVGGAAWIGAGIAGCFDSSVGYAVQAAFLMIAIAVMVLLRSVKKEANDERSEMNYAKAQAAAGMALQLMLCVLMVAVGILVRKGTEYAWNWSFALVPTFMLLIGLSDMITGFVFKRMEDE